MDSQWMIRYVTGDATYPEGDGRKIIAHVCNDVGAWGAGFVLALSQRWKEPEARYREWYARMETPTLPRGKVQIVQVEQGVWVCNLIAQCGVNRGGGGGGGGGGGARICYDALDECLHRLANYAKVMCASVHMPRIGCGLAGGTWDRIGPIVAECLADLDVVVYDLPSTK